MDRRNALKKMTGVAALGLMATPAAAAYKDTAFYVRCRTVGGRRMSYIDVPSDQSERMYNQLKDDLYKAKLPLVSVSWQKGVKFDRLEWACV